MAAAAEQWQAAVEQLEQLQALSTQPQQHDGQSVPLMISLFGFKATSAKLSSAEWAQLIKDLTVRVKSVPMQRPSWVCRPMMVLHRDLLMMQPSSSPWHWLLLEN